MDTKTVTYNFNTSIPGTFLWALKALILAESWSLRIFRESDPDNHVVMDCPGSFWIGPANSALKNDFVKRFIIGERHFQDTNWQIIESKWRG